MNSVSEQTRTSQNTQNTANPIDAEDRSALAKMVMTLLDHWALSTEDQAALLGIASSNRAALTRYRKGEPIGTSRDQYERVGHLMGIHKSLRLLFPQNRELAYRWMSTRNQAFNNNSPVEIIKDWGFAGLLMVRSYLDRARGV
ncbi:MAG: antitoxin Xre/MbcA/ParS toxin-binding domain-containing protein [Herbaspirillum sp.]